MVVLAGIGVGVYLGFPAARAKRLARDPSAAAPVKTASHAGGPTCPLSGTPAPGGQVLQRSAIAVKVDNYPAGRPQSGLTHADIVFEEPVEGGITRFVAVFQCQEASLVGPIRSARAVDAGMLDELSDPIFVHVGGIQPVLQLINAANATNVDLRFDPPTPTHLSGRYAPYDTYVSTQSVWSHYNRGASAPSPIFTYSSAAPAGTPVGTVHIPFSPTNDNTWTWDAHSGQWMLSIGGRQATVLDGNPIGVANVVVMTVNVTYGPWVEDSHGGLEVQFNPLAGGALQVLRNGVAISGQWERSSLSTPTRLLAADGSQISLAPGETWVEIVPSAIPVTTTPPGAGS